MTIDTLLRKFGGATNLAKALGCGKAAISNWKKNGIPGSRKFDLLILAARDGVPLTIAEIEAASPSAFRAESGKVFREVASGAQTGPDLGG